MLQGHLPMTSPRIHACPHQPAVGAWAQLYAWWLSHQLPGNRGVMRCKRPDAVAFPAAVCVSLLSCSRFFRAPTKPWLERILYPRYHCEIIRIQCGNQMRPAEKSVERNIFKPRKLMEVAPSNGQASETSEPAQWWKCCWPDQPRGKAVSAQVKFLPCRFWITA